MSDLFCFRSKSGLSHVYVRSIAQVYFRSISGPSTHSIFPCQGILLLPIRAFYVSLPGHYISSYRGILSAPTRSFDFSIGIRVWGFKIEFYVKKTHLDIKA